MNSEYPLDVIASVYRFVLDRDRWNLAPVNSSIPVLDCNGCLLLAPEIPDCSVSPSTLAIESLQTAAHGLRRYRLRAAFSGRIQGEVQNDILFLADRLICQARYIACAAHGLAHWNVLTPDSEIRADAMHAYIGKPNLAENGQVFGVSEVDISTASHNWLYSPTPPRMLLRRGAISFVVGGTSLAHDFGLELKTANHSAVHFRFNYGGAKFPHPVQANTWQEGPRLQIHVAQDLTNDQAHGAFTSAMIEDGIVTAKRFKPEDDAFLRPWYCTWGDQAEIAEAALVHDMSKGKKYEAVKEALTQEMVLKAARLIRDNALDIGLIIIDDGWQDLRGDWNLVQRRFPAMRGLVDTLHGMGFKVAVWWAPFLIEPGAAILGQRDLVVGPTTKHGEMILNYTNPRTREWLQRKLDLWFGDAPGCWDVDAVKLDFYAEKVEPQTCTHDIEWRGEERQIHHLFEMVHKTIGRYKNSPGILLGPWSSHLSAFYAAAHSEERFDRDLEHLSRRPAMMQALMPGQRFTAHFTYHPDFVPDHVRAVKRLGGIPQVGRLITSAAKPDKNLF